MADTNMKNKGLMLQLAGVIVMVASFNGFFFLKGVPYFIGIIAGVIFFAVCFSKGGSLVRQSREPKS